MSITSLGQPEEALRLCHSHELHVACHPWGCRLYQDRAVDQQKSPASTAVRPDALTTSQGPVKSRRLMSRINWVSDVMAGRLKEGRRAHSAL